MNELEYQRAQNDVAWKINENLQKKLDECNEENRQRTGEIEALKRENDTKNWLYRDCQSQVNRVLPELDQLRKVNDTNAAKLLELTQKGKRCDENVISLEKDKETLKTNLISKEENIAQLKKEISSELEKVKNLSMAEMAKLKNEKEAEKVRLEAQIAELGLNIQEKEKSLSEFKSRISQLITNNEEIQKASAEQVKTIQNLKEIESECINRKLELDTMLTEKGNTILTLEARIKVLENGILECKSQKDNLESVRVQLERELASEKEKTNDKTVRLYRLTRDYNTIKKDLVLVKEELEKSKKLESQFQKSLFESKSQLMKYLYKPKSVSSKQAQPQPTLAELEVKYMGAYDEPLFKRSRH